MKISSRSIIIAGIIFAIVLMGFSFMYGTANSSKISSVSEEFIKPHQEINTPDFKFIVKDLKTEKNNKDLKTKVVVHIERKKYPSSGFIKGNYNVTDDMSLVAPYEFHNYAEKVTDIQGNDISRQTLKKKEFDLIATFSAKNEMLDLAKKKPRFTFLTQKNKAIIKYSILV